MEAEARGLPKFDYAAPISLGEVFELLKNYQDKARLLAGGTDLLVKLKRNAELPHVIIDLNEISELSFIEVVGDYLHIGGLTRLAQIASYSCMQHRLLVMSTSN